MRTVVQSETAQMALWKGRELTSTVSTSEEEKEGKEEGGRREVGGRREGRRRKGREGGRGRREGKEGGEGGRKGGGGKGGREGGRYKLECGTFAILPHPPTLTWCPRKDCTELVRSKQSKQFARSVPVCCLGDREAYNGVIRPMGVL